MPHWKVTMMASAVAVSVALGHAGLALPAKALAAPAEPPARPALQIAPLLDAEKGQRAVAAYARFLDRLCNSLWATLDGKPMRPQYQARNHDVERSPAPHSGNAEARLKRVGLDGADELQLCTESKPNHQPIASGAFFGPGADEVLLVVWRGTAAMEGANTLAVMRNTGEGYQFVTHMLAVTQLVAKLRLTTPEGRDLLMMCDTSGHGGLYPSTCGFLGHGSFSKPRRSRELPTIEKPDPDPGSEPGVHDELTLIDVTECGPAGTVRLGSTTVRADRLLVELLVDDFMLVPAPKVDAEGQCSKRTKVKSQRFTIEYRLEAKRLRRTTPIPRAVTDLLARFY